MTEQELIQEYQTTQSNNALIELTVQFLPLIKIVAKRTVKRHGVSIVEDLVQIGWIGFERAIRDYNPLKGASPKTFFRRRILSEMGHWMRDHYPMIRTRKHDQYYGISLRMMSFDSPVDFDADSLILADVIGEDESGYERVDKRIDALKFLNHLPERKRQAVMLVLSGLTQTAVAKLVGYSQKHVSRICQEVCNEVS